jgi:hypothetical protein
LIHQASRQGVETNRDDLATTKTHYKNMKTNKLCIGLLLAASAVSSYTFAQETAVAANETKTDPAAPVAQEAKEETKTFVLSGSVDTYFRSAFGTVNGTSGLGGTYGPSTSFADLKGFGLGMANLIATYSGEKVGFTADLVFGPRGRAAVFGTGYGDTEQRIINQLVAFYKVSDKVTLNMGQFNTFLGYEVISPAVNFHYSTSYLFSWGPFNHTGLRADFDLGNGMVAKLAVMNPTDILEFNPVNTYTLGGQIGKTSDAGGIWFNVLYGDQDGTLDENDYTGSPESSAGNLFQVDLTTGWNLSETFYLGFNTSMQSVATGEAFDSAGEIQELDGDASSFFGVAVYPKITLSESFALGLRAEYFGVKEGHLSDYIMTDGEGSGSVTEFTLTGNYKVNGLTIIPEFRIDSTSEDSFLDADGEATNMMPSFTLAAVYKF